MSLEIAYVYPNVNSAKTKVSALVDSVGNVTCCHAASSRSFVSN